MQGFTQVRDSDQKTKKWKNKQARYWATGSSRKIPMGSLSLACPTHDFGAFFLIQSMVSLINTFLSSGDPPTNTLSPLERFEDDEEDIIDEMICWFARDIYETLNVESERIGIENSYAERSVGRIQQTNTLDVDWQLCSSTSGECDIFSSRPIWISPCAIFDQLFIEHFHICARAPLYLWLHLSQPVPVDFRIICGVE